MLRYRSASKVLIFLQVGVVFGLSGDSIRAEFNSEILTFHPGTITQLAGQGDERSYPLSLTVRQDYLIWATKFIPLAERMDVRRDVEALDMPIAYSEFRVPREGEVGRSRQGRPQTSPRP